MRFWRRSRKSDRPHSGRKLSVPEEGVIATLKKAAWRRGTEKLLGRHGARFRGFAVSPTESRPYVPGDDVRFLDERLRARTEKDYVKLAAIESSLSCLFVVDGTLSMSFEEKFEAACETAWIGANLFAEYGDAFALFAPGASSPPFLPFARGRTHLAEMKELLERAEPRGRIPITKSLKESAALLRGKTLGVILSDFIAPRSELLHALNALAESGSDLVLVHLLTETERTFPFTDTVLFTDPENGKTRLFEADRVAASYREAIARVERDLDLFAGRRGFTYFRMDPAAVSPADLWRDLLGEKRGPKKW